MAGAVAMSLTCPAVNFSRIGRPCWSTTAWILVVSPPRERPRHRSAPPFCRRALLMDANYRSVDHSNVPVVSFGDRIHQPIPDPRLPPSVEAVVNCRGRPVTLWQIGPSRARSQDPEDAVQHPPIIDPRHTAWLIRQTRLDCLPLGIRQLIPAHRKTPVRELESRPARPVNPHTGFMSLRPSCV